MTFKKNIANYYDFTYNNMNYISDISSTFKHDSGITFMLYCKINKNGSFFDLSSKEIIDWKKKYYDFYFEKEILLIQDRLKPGINYWSKNNNKYLSKQNEDARDNFDIDARIDFVCHDKWDDSCYYYSFCSNKKNADKAYSFYGMHTVKLIKFISYFNREASHLIVEADKPENRMIIPNYSPPNLPEKTRNFVAEMKAANATCKLGDRETEALLLYAAGYTSRQIGEMFHRSPKTIENHLDHIKKKTGCKDRKDLHAYVYDIGLAGMERFFFSYFTHE